MPRKNDLVSRLKRELADLDGELAGLQQQARQTEADLARARQKMASANMDEGLAQARQGREHAADLAELIVAKRAQRDAKAQELAGAEADRAVDQLQKLQAERSEAIAETVAAAKAFKQALDRLGGAGEAVRLQLAGGLVEGQYETLLSQTPVERLADWTARGQAGFEYRTSAGPEDPGSWQERIDRPSDHPAVQAAVQQFRESCRQQAEARLAEPASGDAPDENAAA
jgi:hypothetical protein